MDDNLFKAILAMDSYNRGYKEGVKLEDGSAVVGTILGNVTIIQQRGFRLDDPDVIAGFYAVAYQDNTTDEITVSYRGTDEDFNLTGLDFQNGYGVGTGHADTLQSRMAIQFYQAVIGSNL